MSSYVQLFLGPPDLPVDRVVADVEAATGLRLEPSHTSREGFRGDDGARGVVLITGEMDYDDVPGLPFSAHPYEIVFHTAPKSLESEQRFLEETYRRLRDTGRYDMFATRDVEVRIDPDQPPGSA